jgi:hypothetical protein
MVDGYETHFKSVLVKVLYIRILDNNNKKMWYKNEETSE